MGAQNFDRPEYRDVRQNDLSGGVNDYLNENVVKDTESPSALNVDFDRASVDTAFGSIKFNNQTAPASSIRTKACRDQQPLAVIAQTLQQDAAGSGIGTLFVGNVEVPMRGYGYLPYSAETDIGGDFAEARTSAASTAVLADQYHFYGRRGRSFELNISFRLPQEEKLYEAATLGASALPASALNPSNGFDEALDDTFIVIQKGGDRLAPMSWALGVTNIGSGYGLSSAPQPRVSNYALVFMWYDNAQFGCAVGSRLKYNLTSGQDNTGANAKNATMAYRAVLIHRYIEPGQTYHVAVQLAVDTGTPANWDGTTHTASSWNANGSFKVHVTNDVEGSFTTHSYVDTGSPTTSGMEIVRGPTDSLSYLCRYGIRFSGRDAVFLGLGQRFTPWDRAGFIPFGHDSACIRAGGHSMSDRSSQSWTTLTGAAPVTAAHTLGDAYVTLGSAWLQGADQVGTREPCALADTTLATTYQYAAWRGLQDNVDALRGYRLVVNPSVTTAGPGARLTILSAATLTQLNVLDGATLATFGATGLWVQCFRWNQRDLDIGNVRIWSSPRDYTSTTTMNGATVYTAPVSRRRRSLAMSLDLRDTTEPDIANLLAYWPCSDSDGAVLHEKVIGGLRHGFLCPMANATVESGQRGGKMLFLSGEGEAVHLDLSENQSFQEQMRQMLRQPDQGFGFEISFVETEASYGVYAREPLNGSTSITSSFGVRPVGAPDLIQWDIKESDTGRGSRPRPILTLSHRAFLAENSNTPFEFPLGFGVEVHPSADSQDNEPVQPHALAPWYLSSAGGSAMTNRYDKYASWVGKRLTIQVGVQSYDAATDSYNVYIAIRPKQAAKPAVGDQDDAEFSYWTDSVANSTGGSTYSVSYFDGPQIRIARKDLARTVLTIGGRWDCKPKPSATVALGIHELSARMLVDEVRWFATTPAGALSATTGTILVNRNGKLEGSNCLPQRLLSSNDLLYPLGQGVARVNVTQGSRTVTPVSSTSFFQGTPASSVNSVTSAYMYVDGDKINVSVEESLSEPERDFYYIDSVASGGTKLTLANAYRDRTKTAAAAYAFRVIGYTAFEDSIEDSRLYLGRGEGYNPQTATVDNVLVSQGFWQNLAPTGGYFKLRIYSPYSVYSSEDVLPSWSRGVVIERRYKDDGILGLYGYNNRVFAGVRGSLYEADDRWRTDGPTDELFSSLRFRSSVIKGSVLAPLESDRVVFSEVTNLSYVPSSTNTYAYVYDYWAKLDQVRLYQGVAWFGSVNAPLDSGAYRVVQTQSGTLTYTTTSVVAAAAWVGAVTKEMYVTAGTYTGQVTSVSGTTVNVTAWVDSTGTVGTPAANTTATVFVPGHKTQYQLRYNEGQPQFVIGSTGEISAGVRPEKGLFVASAETVISPDEWHHVRWVAPTGDNGGAQFMLTPRCYINGKRVNVRVNAYESGGSSVYWLRTANIVSPGNNTNTKMALGALRDSFVDEPTNALNTTNTSTVVAPQRYQGWLHSLTGHLSHTIITQQTWSGTDYPNFDPYSVSYQTAGTIPRFSALASDIGVGHKVKDDASSTPGVIYSHPMISLYHACGNYSNPFSFAENGAQVYATNGGRPVVVVDIDDKATPFAFESGVPAPKVELDFTTTRFPLWILSSQAATEQRDPIASGTDVYALNNQGNSYLEQDLGNAMVWSSGRFFFFKALWTPKDTVGRINLFRHGDSANNGGPFVECVDGRIRYGWYDLAQKREVYIETDSEVVTPGRVHYIHIRHRFPAKDKIWGNWRNSYFANGHYRRFIGTVGATGGVAIATTLYGRNGGTDLGQYRVIKAWAAGSTVGSAFIIDAVRINNAAANLIGTAGDVLRDAAGGGGNVVMNVTTGADNALRPMNDLFIVQAFSNSRVSQTDPSPTTDRHLPLDVIHANDYAWTQATYGARTSNTNAEERSYLSLTTDEYFIPGSGSVFGNRFKATGLVTLPWLAYQVVNTDEIQTTASAIQDFGCFHWLQLTGCIFEFLDDASTTLALRGRQFIITEVKDEGAAVADRLKRLKVVNLDGSVPGLTAGNNGYGGVFVGKTLVKSEGFDDSDGPDNSQTKVIAWGSNEKTTFQPFNGKVHSFGVGTEARATGDLCNIFETLDSTIASAYATRVTNDPMFVGVDYFNQPANSVYVGGATPNAPTGPLLFENSRQYIQVNGALWSAPTTVATTQPNAQLEVANTSTVTSTGGVESKFHWRYLQSSQTWLGKRYVAVGFYDPVQGIAGNPGPVLTVDPAGNDVANDAGPVAINLSNIPAAPSGQEIWVYVSAADGNAASLFRVERLANGTSSFQLQALEDEIAFGPPAEFINDQPPRCEVVASSKGSMIYAALQVQPDGVVPSRPASPGQVDYSKLFRIQGGSGDKVTGAIEFDGNLIVTKRRIMASVSFVGGGFAVPEIVSSGVGCVAHNTLVAKDNVLLFMSDRGLQATTRRGVTNLNSPEYIGDNISTFVQDVVSKKDLDRCYATMNRRRSQYVCVVRVKDEQGSNYRFTCDLTGEGPIFSIYRLPNLTSLAIMPARDGGDEHLVGGTEEGFVVYLDREDTNYALLGGEPAIWGLPVIQNYAASTASALATSYANQTDTALEGPRGVTASYLDANGVLREAVALFADGQWLQFSEVLPAVVPANANVALGDVPVHYETRWMDMGNSERRKLLQYVNFVFGREQAGEVVVRVYTDWDKQNVRAETTLDLTQAKQEVTLGDVEGNWFKITLDSKDVSPGLRFTLSSIVWRLDDTDQV